MMDKEHFMDFPSDVFRILQFAMQHEDDKVKAYARNLAKKYRAANNDTVADLILAYIGDIEMDVAVMDGNNADLSK